MQPAVEVDVTEDVDVIVADVLRIVIWQDKINNMNKNQAIILIAVAVAVGGYFVWKQTKTKKQ